MSTCGRWMIQLDRDRSHWLITVTRTCKEWANQATSTCQQWADQGSNQCSQWKDEGSNQCSQWKDEGSNQCSQWADQGSNQCCDWAPCSWFCDAFYWVAKWVCIGWYWVANWVCQAWYWVANWVCQAWYWVAKWVCVIWVWIFKWVCIFFANIVNFIWVAVTKLVWVGCRGVLGGGGETVGPIKHVFVLVLENRSFDHMLGRSTGSVGEDGQWLNLTGTDAITGLPTEVNGPAKGEANDWNGNTYSVGEDAPYLMPADPPHEFANVRTQLTELSSGLYTEAQISLKGFVESYMSVSPAPPDPDQVMQFFSRDKVPVIRTLAEEFAVCDNWFAAIPGPTWPNRFFFHAASSGGLDDSPSTGQVISSETLDGYKFDNGTIYDMLEAEGFDWAVYHGDAFPQVLAITGMLSEVPSRYHDLDEFADDVSDPDFSPSYVFIEPDYGHVITHGGNFQCGNSQHPIDDITRGDRLVKQVYEAIRSSPHWQDSLLVIGYDEHGGFYDHVTPPEAVPPGDSITDPDNNHNNFGFDIQGVRVPAVLVSPWIPRNTIDHTQYDHTSLLATAEMIFGLPPLTQRDNTANDFFHLFSLTSPRDDAPTTLPDPPDSGFHCDDDPQPATGTAQSRLQSLRAGIQAGMDNPEGVDPMHDPTPLDSEPELRGFLQIALRRELHLAMRSERAAILKRVASVETVGQANQYIAHVAVRIERAQIREKSSWRRVMRR